MEILSTGGGIARGPSYKNGVPKALVQEEFRKQAKIFVEGGIDFLICEVCPEKDCIFVDRCSLGIRHAMMQ